MNVSPTYSIGILGELIEWDGWDPRVLYQYNYGNRGPSSGYATKDTGHWSTCVLPGQFCVFHHKAKMHYYVHYDGSTYRSNPSGTGWSFP